MKDKILAFLVAKLVGIQKSFLEGVADTFSKTITDDAQIEQTFNEGVLSALKFSAQQLQIEGDRRATEASDTSVKNYEKKYNLKDGKILEKQSTPTAATTQTPDDVPAWAKSIIEANKTLTEKLTAFEQKQTKEEKLLQAQNALKASKLLPENLKQKWSGRINPELDITIEDQIKELETEYTEINTLIIGQISGKGLPVGGSVVTGEAKEEEVNEVLNKI